MNDKLIRKDHFDTVGAVLLLGDVWLKVCNRCVVFVRGMTK
jgi:hypothetical protein